MKRIPSRGSHRSLAGFFGGWGYRHGAADGGWAPLACLMALLVPVGPGCAGPRPLHGGHAVTAPKPAGGVEQSLDQGDNPAQASKQDQETVKVRSYTVPAGSRIEEATVQSAASGKPVTNVQTVVVSAPMPIVERTETRAQTELGAAQKDTARELGAKLASLKGIVWVGVGLFIFGIGSLVWPPLKAVIGSVTTSIAITVGGVALMILPTLVVGNELLILGGVALVAGAWFLAHRHGELRGQLKSAASVPHPVPAPKAATTGLRLQESKPSPRPV